MATSDDSARVGRGLRIIESSICVAVIASLPRLLAASIAHFWITGTTSRPISTPRSPRARP
ncbi:MAG: hypothetical protein R3A51_11920 [Nannocystaceae bacterium]